MPSVELGVFIAFILIPFASIVILPKLRSWGLVGTTIAAAIGIVGLVMLGGIALIFFSQFDVVQTEAEVFYHANGTQSGSAVKTAPVINAFHNELGYVVFGITILFGVVYFKIMAGA